jgi:hypothetical protein
LNQSLAWVIAFILASMVFIAGGVIISALGKSQRRAELLIEGETMNSKAAGDHGKAEGHVVRADEPHKAADEHAGAQEGEHSKEPGLKQRHDEDQPDTKKPGHGSGATGHEGVKHEDHSDGRSPHAKDAGLAMDSKKKVLQG